MATEISNVDRMATDSKEAAETLTGLLFGEGPEPAEPQEQEEEEPGEEPDVADHEGEEEQDDPEGEPEGEQEEEEGEEDEPASFQEFLDPLQEYIPEGTEIKTAEDYKKFVGDFVAQYKEKEKVLSDEIEANQVLIDMFEAHPELASISRILARDKNANFRQALYSVIDPEDVVPDKASDPEAYADYILAKREKETAAKRAEEEFKTNLDSSDKVIEKFRESNEFDKQTIGTIMEKAQTFLKDVNRGVVTEQFLQVLAKGLNFDTAVADAATKGEVRGKNEAANKAKRQKKGDGLPKPKNASGSSSKGKSRSSDPMQQMLMETFRAAADPFYR